MRILAIVALLAGVSYSGMAALALDLPFWEPRDLCDAVNVRCEAVPLNLEESTVLLPIDPSRPSLWYNPAAVIPDGDRIRVYYQRVNKVELEYRDQRALCVGYLKPGGSFELPDLGILEQGWEGPRNVVMQRSPHTPTWGGFNVFQLWREADDRYRMLYWDQPGEGDAGALIAASTDGLHWTKSEARAVFTEHNDAYSVVEKDEGYQLFQTRLIDWPDKPFKDNLPDHRRVISLRSSPDLAEWTPQADVILPDDLDSPSCEFYLLKAFRTSGRLLGLLMKYYGDPSAPGKHSALYRHELVFSSDGISWRRPYRETDMGVWTYSDPFEFQGRLCIVGYHPEGIRLWRARSMGWGCAKADQTGSFLSQTFVAPEGEITLNADCSEGWVTVGVVDSNGREIPGWESAVCRIENRDGTEIPLRWGNLRLADLSGQTIRLRFSLANARAYGVFSVNR